MTHKNKYVSVQETRAQVTREKLLSSAIKLVNQHGMKYLTVRNICDEAGLSTGSFYNLFSGKDELIAYYLKHSFYRFKLQAEESEAGHNAIEKTMIVYRFYIDCCKEVGLEFVSGLYSANLNPFFDFLHRESEDDLILDVVRSYLEEGKEEGIFKQDLDVDEALLRIASTVTGLLFYWCTFKGKFNIKYQVDSMLEVYLRSIAIDSNIEINLEPLELGCFE